MARKRRRPRHQGLGSRLRETRQEQELSQRSLGERAGVNHMTIYNVEAETYSAGVAIVEKLADALGVSPAWLAYGLGPKTLDE